MRAFVLYNSRYRDVAKEAARCLASFAPYRGWEPELFDGCEPRTLGEWDAMYRIDDRRAKTRPGDPRHATKKSCFYSHFALWHGAVKAWQPIVVVEYDTECVGDWAIDPPADGVVHLSLQSFCRNAKNRYSTNWPDEPDLLAGQAPGLHDIAGTHRGRAKRDMPGNTAYLVTPSAAQAMIDDCRRHGWQQNDNLMTRDKFPLRYAIPSPIAYLEERDRHTSHRALRR